MFKIAIQGIKGQRSMSVLMVTVLILSFLFLTLTSAVTTSVDHTQQLERERMYGRHQMLYYGSEETAQELQGAFPGAQASLTVGTTQSGQNVATISGSFQQLANLTLSEGTLPRKRMRSCWWAANGDIRWEIRSRWSMCTAASGRSRRRICWSSICCGPSTPTGMGICKRSLPCGIDTSEPLMPRRISRRRCSARWRS